MSTSPAARRLLGKTVVITGASSGIGRSTAFEFARASPLGLKLILAARRIEALHEIASSIKREVGDGVKILPVKLDVASSEDVRQFVPNLPEEFRNIDILINNAYGSPKLTNMLFSGLVKGVARAPEIAEQDIGAMISTNVTGLISMTQAVLPIFQSRPNGGSGDIINVGSIAGREPYAGGSIYCATKAAVRKFSVVRFYGDKAKADAVYAGCDPLTPGDIAEVILAPFNVLTIGRIGHFTIVDDAPVTDADLGANFFLDEGCLGQPRAEACAERLLELNPEVQGNWHPRSPPRPVVVTGTKKLCLTGPSWKPVELSLVLQATSSFSIIIYTHPINADDLALITSFSVTQKIPLVSGMRTNNAEGGEENFEEAVSAVLKAISRPELPTSLMQIFSHAKHPTGNERSTFWLIASAIQKFYNSHGQLPLPGRIPDMKTTSDVYVKLQNIYKTKARADALEVLGFVNSEWPGSTITLKEIELFCRNAAFARLINTQQEFTYARTAKEVGMPPSLFPIYIALRIAQEVIKVITKQLD
ncbi:unnamed protein product [Parascedosporium putredinis]|uniref:Uncharacterized protein n=1 Tax=Parascedosporium putredinis TaxID=1442378 RepID=A0A9P1GZ65_9PEZI|nr:unnamed protein product [Parascedosporium putredinis]CAI7991482.1 unnamed protein product [Parascedosporium putredinis]